MNQSSASYIRTDFTFAFCAVFSIFILQNVYLFLQTGTIGTIIVSNANTPSQTVQTMLVISIIKLLAVTLSGFALTLYLPTHRIRNIIVLGIFIGIIWGMIGLIQIIFSMINTPPQLVDTSSQSLINILLFVPKEIIVNTITTCIGFVFAYSNQTIKGEETNQ